MSKPTVLIIFSIETTDIAYALLEGLGQYADIIAWSETLSLDHTPVESLLAALERIDFAVGVLDNRAKPGSQNRDSVIFELGVIIGKLGRHRTFIVAPDESDFCLPLDISGSPILRLDPARLDSNLVAAMAPAVNKIRKAIVNMGYLAGTGEYYPCFLSYSVKDQEFVDRLYTDLQEAGVRCWLDSHEISFGDSMIKATVTGIREHDRLLVVLSKASE